MIAFLRGTVREKGDEYAVIETSSGVGYLVSIASASSLWELMQIDEEISLFISHQIRENGQDLYGFRSGEERNFFEQLLTVSGVGPKLASTLVASLGQEALANMILSEDVAGIDAVPGIGKKTAERIIVYLRDRVLGGDTTVVSSSKRKQVSTKDTNISVVVQALEKLGFNARERESMLNNSDEKQLEGKSVEEVLKLLLSTKNEKS